MRRFLLPLLLLAAASSAYAQYNAGSIPPPASLTPAMLAADTPSDNDCLTYDLATLAFIWDTCGGGGSGAPTDAKYIVAELHSGLSAEIAPGGANLVPVSSGTTNASWTTVPDAALTSNYSGVGSCSTGGGVTATVDNAAPTCDAHVMFDNEASTVTQNMTFDDGSGNSPVVAFKDSTLGVTFEISASPGQLDIVTDDAASANVNFINNQGAGAGVMNVSTDGTFTATNYPSGAADDQALVATSSTVSAWKTLPSGAVSYGTSFNTFSQADISNLASSTSAQLATVLSDEGGSGVALFGTLLKVSGSNFTTTSTSNQTITGLSWSGASGTNYWFRCNLAVTGTATGGPRISVTSSGASTTISYGIRHHTTAATTQLYTGGSASGTQTASCAASCLTTDIPFEITGMIRPSAAVTLAIAAANSTSGQTTTVKIGSSCLVTTP